jgi:glycolate oxidase
LDNAVHLRDLILSSEGTLGVIVEATLKTYVIPETRIRELFGFGEPADACSAIRKMVDGGLVPEVVMIPSRERIYNEALLPLLSKIDVPSIIGDSKAFVLVAHAGDERYARWSMGETERIARVANGRLVDDTRVVDSYWTNLTEVGAVLTPQMAAAYRGYRYNSTRNGIPLGAFPEFVAGEKSAVAEMSRLVDAGITAYVLLPELDAIPVCGALLVDTDGESVSEFNRFLGTVSKLSKALGGSVCSAAGMGTQFRKYVDLELGSSKGIGDAIKRALDPANIMNPGKLA